MKKNLFLLVFFTLCFCVTLIAQSRAVRPPEAFVGTWHQRNNNFTFAAYNVLEIGADGSMLRYGTYNASFHAISTVTAASGSQITRVVNSTGRRSTLRLVGQSLIESIVWDGRSWEERWTKGPPPGRR